MLGTLCHCESVIYHGMLGTECTLGTLLHSQHTGSGHWRDIQNFIKIGMVVTVTFPWPKSRHLNLFGLVKFNLEWFFIHNISSLLK